jgi:ABC-2 type transport system ATP-binding protein
VVENNRRFNVKVCGNQREVLDAIKSVPGVCFAEALAQKDVDAYTYTVESEYGTDVRKKLFFTLAAKGLAIIGLEAVGMSLEDIFISVVEKTEEKPGAVTQRYARNVPKKRERHTRNTLEKDLAEGMIRDAEQRRQDSADDGEDVD